MALYVQPLFLLHMLHMFASLVTWYQSRIRNAALKRCFGKFLRIHGKNNCGEVLLEILFHYRHAPNKDSVRSVFLVIFQDFMRIATLRYLRTPTSAKNQEFAV